MTAIISPLVSLPVRHLMRMIKSPQYRLYLWLSSLYGRTGKGVEKRIKAGNLRLTVPDAQAFLWDYQELFYNEIYKFVADNDTPRIVDCGANIGLSVLYFKSLYPKARITAFEADPKIFRYLARNLEANGAHDVEKVAKAVWSEETTLSFSSQGGDAGRIDAGGDGHLVQVPTVALNQILSEETDLLKIDVEGAELEVLKGAGEALRNCKQVFVEYHSFGHRKQVLPELLALMQSHGFRAHICPEYHAPHPFVARPLHARMDLRLNMFFIREQNS
jgi:FkbM family methyltransferase